MEELNHRKRVRAESDPARPEFDLDSSNAKKFKDDLLSILDDPEPVPESDPDLDSVIRSFEEEIVGSGSESSVVDLTSDSGDNLTADLSQLFGGSEFSEIGELWNFQDELLPSYDDSFGLGVSYDDQHDDVAAVDNKSNNNNNNQINDNSSDYVALDGIFDYSDMNFGSDFLWRQDTLPAM